MLDLQGDYGMELAVPTAKNKRASKSERICLRSDQTTHHHQSYNPVVLYMGNERTTIPPGGEAWQSVSSLCVESSESP